MGEEVPSKYLFVKSLSTRRNCQICGLAKRRLELWVGGSSITVNCAKNFCYCCIMLVRDEKRWLWTFCGVVFLTNCFWVVSTGVLLHCSDDENLTMCMCNGRKFVICCNVKCRKCKRKWYVIRPLTSDWYSHILASNEVHEFSFFFLLLQNIWWKSSFHLCSDVHVKCNSMKDWHKDEAKTVIRIRA